MLLLITTAGLEAIGIDSGDAQRLGRGEDARSAPTGGPTAAPRTGSPTHRAADEPEQASAGHTGPRSRKTRESTKQAALVEMLKRPQGATIPEIVEATGWQPHTVRGSLAGALKKRLGLIIASERSEQRGRVYRIA